MSEKETTTVTISRSEDEWYQHYYICDDCEAMFMCSNAKFCPCCGKEIADTIGEKLNNIKSIIEQYQKKCLDDADAYAEIVNVIEGEE